MEPNPLNNAPKNENLDVDQALQKKKKIFKAAVVNTTALMEAQARDLADEKMTEDAKGEKKGWFKKQLHRIWKHNLAQEYYRQKEISKARKAITESENLYIGEDGVTDSAESDEAMKAVVERFTDEYSDQLMKKGEKKDAPINNEDINKLVREFASTDMSEKEFKKQRDTILKTLDPSYKKSGTMHTDNLLAIAQEIRKNIEHGEKLEEMDTNIELTLGTARERLNTEAQRNGFDRGVEWLQNSKLGKRFANEAVVAAGAIIWSAGKAITQKAVRSRASALVTFGGSALASGALAGIKERARFNRERAQDAREIAKGKEFESDAKRRNEMAKFRYETIKAALITASLNEGLTKLENGTLSGAELQSVLASFAEIDSRIVLGAENKIDLVTYSSFAAMEKESLELERSRIKMKIALRKAEAAGTVTLPGAGTFEEKLAALSNANTEKLKAGDTGIDKKDSRFRTERFKRSLKRAGKTLLVGATIGVVGQEIVHGVENMFGYGNDGLIAGTVKGVRGHFNGHHGEGLTKDATALESLRRWMTGNEPRMPLGSDHNIVSLDPTNPAATQMHLPDGVTMTQNVDGTFNILRDGVGVAHNVSIHTLPNGDFDEATKDALNKADIYTSYKGIDTPAQHIVQSSDEYMKTHGTKIHYGKWYDNDTKAFDKNELKGWWGGEKNTGVDADGNIVFNMSHMKTDGSFHHGVAIDAKEMIKNHELKMAFAMSQGTQHYVMYADIDENGNAIIDKNSDLYKQMFSIDEKGHAVFNGRFAQVVASEGIGADGQETIDPIATVVGKGIEFAKPVDIPGGTIGHVTFDVPEGTDPILPPFVPLVPRTPLEKGKNGKPLPPTIPPVPPVAIKDIEHGGSTQTYYGGFSPQDLWKEMEQFNIVPDTYYEKEVDGKKVFVDKEGNPVKRNLEKERAFIRDYLDRQDKAYLAELRQFESQMEKMNEKCRVSVTIPARFEEKNLPNLLDQYVKQVDANGDPLDKDLFEINVIVNRKQGETPDGSVQAIEAWKQMNPGYHINVIDIEFPKEKANVGMARKYITDLTLLRSIERPKADGALYLESEDADLYSIDKRTIGKLIEGFDSKEYLDVLRGIQDRQPEVLQKNDLLFFDRRMWDMGEILMRNMAYRPENMQGSSLVWNRVISGGWNTAYTAQAYAQIGGYVSDLMGEDMKIGQKISLLRGVKDKNGNHMPNTMTAETSGLRSNSSPRRFIDAMNRKMSPYDDFENQSLKEKTLDELLEGAKDVAVATVEQKGAYEGAINTLYNFIKSQMPGDKAEEVMRRILWVSGLNKDNFEMDRNSVRLNDTGMPKIISLLTSYKNENRFEKGYRRQNNPLGITPKGPKVPAQKAPVEEYYTDASEVSGSLVEPQAPEEYYIEPGENNSVAAPLSETSPTNAAPLPEIKKLGQVKNSALEAVQIETTSVAKPTVERSTLSLKEQIGAFKKLLKKIDDTLFGKKRARDVRETTSQTLSAIRRSRAYYDELLSYTPSVPSQFAADLEKTKVKVQKGVVESYMRLAPADRDPKLLGKLAEFLPKTNE